MFCVAVLSCCASLKSRASSVSKEIRSAAIVLDSASDSPAKTKTCQKRPMSVKRDLRSAAIVFATDSPTKTFAATVRLCVLVSKELDVSSY
jgi:hypothetical protein